METFPNKTLIQEPVAGQELLDILLIEDNPGDIVIVNDLLKRSGHPYTLTKVSTLCESFVLMKEKKFDVVLLDLGLPDSSGLDTLKEFLALMVAPPVVVMTGFDDEDTALASLREGAQDYLVKNKLDSENIIRSIKYSIERKKLHDLQKQNSHQLSVLSATSAAFHEVDDIDSIYTIVCRSIRQLVDNSITISVEFKDDVNIIISNHEQLLPWAQKINSVLGFDINTPIRVTGQQKELINSFLDGKLLYMENGIYQLLGESVSLKDCDKLQRSIGFRYTYVTGFLRNPDNSGGLLIFAKDPIGDSDLKIIENLCSQASLSLYRSIIKHNLVLSEARYQKLALELEKKVRKRTRELEKVNLQLNKELKERMLAEQALIKNQAQLRELNATKDKFFNIVAHDLKNPFTSLLGATELLSENIRNMDREKIVRLSKILNDSAKSGYSILLNLLDWSRSQTGMIKINPQKINLKKLLDENLADIHLSSLDKQITLSSEIGDDIFINADKNMLNTILRNLISNAVKFTRKGGKVKVKGEVIDKEVLICVKDNGIGISGENIEKLFRIDSKFSRPGTEKELGTGLGLKLSKEFVEKLGGKIWVNSIEDEGSEFYVSIPLT